MINIKHLTKIYGNRKILDDISLELPKKGFVILLGESGSGKTTLLNCIGGIESDYKGEIIIQNQCLSYKNDAELRDFRINNIGYVFQNFELLNLETVYRNIKIILDCISSQNTRIKERRVDDVLDSLEIKKLKNKIVNKLSGGEKQRVAIARALINSPSLLLCDEPTGALDENNGKQIIEILKRISKEKLVIVATHDESIKKYADIVINIENGKITKKLNVNKISKNDKRIFFGENFKHKKAVLPLMFKISNSLQKIKAKKFRSLIINAVLSLSLTGIGLSFLLTSSISTKISEAFSSLTNGNQIVMSLKNENPNIYSGIYSAPINKIESLYEKYSYYLDGYGTTYLVNFEDFFKDRNEFALTSSAYKFKIDSLSTRSINDYRWLDKNDSTPTYPYLIDTLEKDEVVLGLSYVDMVNICFQLKIQRNYSSLGEYIRKNDLLISLAVENKQWSYDDEQLFIVKGVKEVNNTCFFHYDHLWNQKVFEMMMLLPSDDDNESYYPWEMHKIYYFKTIDDPGQFIDMTLYDEDVFDFAFERTSYSYHPLLCKINEICEEKRVLVYYVDKQSIEPSIIRKLCENEKELSNYYFTSDYGYASYASNMLSGFSKTLYISLNKDNLNAAIDADSKVTDENIYINLPDGVVSGNYLNGINGGLRFSTKMDKLIKGRKPKNNNEIVISNGLNKKLSEDSFGKELYISGVNNEYLVNDLIEKEYSTAKVVIVGVVDEEKDYLYHNQNWSISFFRDRLGISMFSLTPENVVFELDQNIDTDEICSKYEKVFSNYKFSSPTKEIKSSINATLEYAKIILLSFSIVSIILSIILLSSVVSLNIMESKDEVRLFRFIGISKKDTNSTFVVQSLIHGLIASFFSMLELIASDIAISIALNGLLGSNLAFSINILPLVVVIAFSITISFITSSLTVKFIKI